MQKLHIYHLLCNLKVKETSQRENPVRQHMEEMNLEEV